MAPNSMMSRAASALTAVGFVLVLANWYAKPEAALAWTAPLAMFAVMFAALRLSRRALRRSTGDALRSPDWIPTAVVFAALMMGIPLALTLARSYGSWTTSTSVAARPESSSARSSRCSGMSYRRISHRCRRCDATAHGNRRFSGSPAGRGCFAVLRRRSAGSRCQSTPRK